MGIELSVTSKRIEAGSKAFRNHERRDAMYKVATFLVGHFWGRPRDMSDALGVLLLTWNNALYRYGMFDLPALEKALQENMRILKSFRRRNIASLDAADEPAIDQLFCLFLDALKVAEGKMKNCRSPVAVAKALHLLAPSFFPLWDNRIARAYKCNYSKNPAAKYIAFMRISKGMAAKLDGKVRVDGTTLLKKIDEYNYARFTKRWI